MMAFAPNKTSNGFNQGGGFRVSQQRREENKTERGPGKSVRTKTAPQKSQRGKSNTGTGIIQQTFSAETDHNQKLELIKFYCKILEKGLHTGGSSLVTTKGGRDAFLQDIEKLKNAQEGIAQTLERLQQQTQFIYHGTDDAPIVSPRRVEGNIPQVFSGSSGVESSLISPPGGDSLHGGMNAENLNRQLDQNVNSAGMGSGMALEYSEDNLALQSKTPVGMPLGKLPEYNPGIAQSQMRETLDEKIDGTPISPIPGQTRSINETRNDGRVPDLLVELPSMHEDAKRGAKKPAILINQDSQQEERFTPLMDPPTKSQLVIKGKLNQKDKDRLKTLVERSIDDSQQNDKQRINIISKLKNSSRGQSIEKQSGSFMLAGTPPPISQASPRSVQINVMGSKSPVKQLQSLPNEFDSDGHNLMNNQVFIHRFRKRNEEEKLKSQNEGVGHLNQPSPSPKKKSGNIFKNRDLEGMWSPPDMTRLQSTMLGQPEPTSPKYQQVQALTKSPQIKSPPKELHRQLSNSSLKSLRSPRNIPGAKDIPVQLQAVQALAGQFQISQGHGVGGLGLVRQPSTTFQTNPTKVTIPFASIKDFSSTGQTQQPQHQHLNPGIITVGSLSFFNDLHKQTSKDGCFPNRVPGVNEQRFFKKGFTKETLKQQRAQTASAIGRAAQKKKGKDQPNLNTTMNGFKLQQPELEGQKANDGTVVLQATLVMGNQQFTHAFKQVKSMKQNFNENDNISFIRQPSPEAQQLRMSSELKVRRVQQHSNNPTLLQNKGVLSPTNPTLASDASFFKVHSISPRHVARAPSDLSPDVTTNTMMMQRRYKDGPSSLNVNGMYEDRRVTLSREGGFDNSGSRKRQNEDLQHGNRKNILAKTKKSFVQEIAKAYQSLPSGVIKLEDNEGTPTAQLDITLPATQPGAASIANLSSKQQSNGQLMGAGIAPETLNQQTPSLEKRSRSKSGSQIRMMELPGYLLGPVTLQHSIGTDDTGTQNGIVLSTTQTPTLYMLPNTADVLILHQNHSESRQLPGHSPGQISSKKGSIEVGGITLAEMLKKNQGQHVKMMKKMQESGNKPMNYDLGSLMPQVMGQRVVMTQHQQHRTSGAKVDLKMEEKRNTLNTDAGMSFTGMLQKFDPQIFSSGQPASLNSTLNFSNGFNQTGVFSSKTQYKTERFNSVRTSAKGSRPMHSGGDRRKNIEFKILKMNLAMPPTSENSNMMTCEVDLSSHIFNKFKTQQGPQTLSKTLNLAVQNPKFVQSSAHLQGTSIHLLPQASNINQESAIRLSLPNSGDQQATNSQSRTAVGSRQRQKRDLNSLLQRPMGDGAGGMSQPSIHLGGNDRLGTAANNGGRKKTGVESPTESGSNIVSSSQLPQSQLSNNLVQRPFGSSAGMNPHNSHQLSDPTLLHQKGNGQGSQQRIDVFSQQIKSSQGMLQTFGRPPLKSPGEETPSLLSSAHLPMNFAVNVATRQVEQTPTHRSSALFRQNNPMALVNQLRKEPMHTQTTTGLQKPIPRLQLPSVVGLQAE